MMQVSSRRRITLSGRMPTAHVMPDADVLLPDMVLPPPSCVSGRARHCARREAWFTRIS